MPSAIEWGEMAKTILIADDNPIIHAFFVAEMFDDITNVQGC